MSTELIDVILNRLNQLEAKIDKVSADIVSVREECNQLKTRAYLIIGAVVAGGSIGPELLAKLFS